jgi:broad specificity phosphatase PhoE
MTLRSVAVVLCASVALTAHAFQGPGSSARTAKGHAQAMAAIEKLHAQDVAATLFSAVSGRLEV